MSKKGRTLAEMMKDQQQVADAPVGSLEAIFRIEPVPLEVFLYDRGYLRQPKLSEPQFNLLRHVEQVLLPKTYIQMVEGFGLEWAPVRMVNLLAVEAGKGSGKDMMARLGAARIINLLLCMWSPQEYFGMPAWDSIHTLNVASSASQAQRAYFEPLRKLVAGAKCFRGMFKEVSGPVGRRAKEEGGRLPGINQIEFENNLVAISGHSDAASQEGLNPIFGCADEIDAFPVDEEVTASNTRRSAKPPSNTAEAIWKMIRTSGATRFPQTYKALVISWPRWKGSPIQKIRKTGEADIAKKGEKSRYYCVGPLATWEMRPNISKSFFEEDYEEDPVMARTMYECDPEASTKRYYRNEEAIYAAFSLVRADPVRAEYYWGRPEVAEPRESKDEPEEKTGWQVRYHLDDLQPRPGAQYAMHADLAIKRDVCGVAMSHVRAWTQDQWLEGEALRKTRPIVKLDFALALEADITADPVAREVQIRWVRQLVWLLRARRFNVKRVTFDNFQSKDSMQILESRGVESERLSLELNTEPWETARDVIYDERFEGYKNAKVVDELLALTEVRRMRTTVVQHPPGGSDDMAQAVVGSIVGAVLLGGKEHVGERGAEDFRVASPFGTHTGGAFPELGFEPSDLLPPRP